MAEVEGSASGQRQATAFRVVQVVTILFTDIEGSTQLARSLGPRDWPEILADHHRLLERAIQSHSGTVVETEGDAFLAFFPTAAEAVAAAVEAQQDLRRHAWGHGIQPLRVRMGIHTGTVQTHATGWVGIDLHLAARVAGAANGGQILVSSATLGELDGRVPTRDLGQHRLKDFPQPEHLHQVLVSIDDPTPAPRAEQVRPTNLPPQTRTLIGRAQEREQLAELLRSGAARVVTVVGMGGVGKTRLALEVASDLLDEMPGGVFLVPLAGVRDGTAIAPAIAEALGVSGDAELPLEALLTERLAHRRTLLVLDNFEQLVHAAQLVAQLISHASELRVLITSQLPLRIVAEHVFPLGPLGRREAAQLFIERARSRVGSFEPDPEGLAAIDLICTRLDDVPLGIELAAARVSALDPRALAARLERPLAVLTRGERDLPQRQQSLRATIGWTYGLLGAEQRNLFNALGICAGPVPLSMVEALAGPQADPAGTLDDLETLLDCSLARRVGDPRFRTRFLMPQALRDYALEQLLTSGLHADVSRRHAEHVAEVAHGARLWKWGATEAQREALLAVSGEIRVAVTWARQNDSSLHVRLCACLGLYWLYRGIIVEATEELERARSSGSGERAERAWVLTLLAKCMQLRRRGEEANVLADEAMVAWSLVEDERERAIGLGDLNWVLRWSSRFGEAKQLAEDSLLTLRGTGDRRLILRALVYLAQTLADMHDVSGARAVIEEADAMCRGDPAWELDAIRGDCAMFAGDHLEALRFYAKSLEWTSESGESHQVLMDMRCLVLTLVGAGHPEAALEVSELTKLVEDDTGRVGTFTELADDLVDCRFRARQAVGDAVAAQAAERARATDPSKRVRRALELAAAAIGSG